MPVLVSVFYRKKESFWERKSELFPSFLIRVKAKKRFTESASNLLAFDFRTQLL